MAVPIRFDNTFFQENRRVEYHPTDIQHADITSTAYVRQNPWRAQTKKWECLQTGILSIPHAHDKMAVDRFREDGTVPEGQARQMAEFPLGTVVYVPDGRGGVLVRIVSEVKAGILPALCIVREARECDHTFTSATQACGACSNSVISVSDSPLREALDQGYLIEPFYSLYRECEPVAYCKIPTQDLRHFAGSNSVGKTTTHWCRVERPLVDYYEDAI